MAPGDYSHRRIVIKKRNVRAVKKKKKTIVELFRAIIDQGFKRREKVAIKKKITRDARSRPSCNRDSELTVPPFTYTCTRIPARSLTHTCTHRHAYTYSAYRASLLGRSCERSDLRGRCQSARDSRSVTSSSNLVHMCPHSHVHAPNVQRIYLLKVHDDLSRE